VNDYLNCSRKRCRFKDFFEKLIPIFSIFLIVLVSLMWMKLCISQAQSPKTYEKRLVQEGDTLWGYAQEKCGLNADIREYVWKVREVNKLEDAKILPGQVIMLPEGEE